jgi:hypothetical protein
MHHIRSAPDTEVDVFASHGTIYDSGYDDGRESDGECDFANQGRRRPESGRCDEWTCVVIYHYGYGEVKRDCESLHECESFSEVAGILEFGGEGKERHMAGCTLISSLFEDDIHHWPQSLNECEVWAYSENVA